MPSYQWKDSHYNQKAVPWPSYLCDTKPYTLKWKGSQGDSPDIHWRRWRQASVSPVNTKAVTLMTFAFLCTWKDGLYIEMTHQTPQITSEFSRYHLCVLPIPTADQGPIPLMIFRSNLKFNQNLQCSDLKGTLSTKTKFCTRHDSATVLTCAKFHCD